MMKSIMLAAIACAMFGMQACFSSSTTEQAAAPTCDAQGNNCQASTTKKSSWGFFF